MKFKDLDVDSLLMYMQIYNTPKIHARLTELMVRSTMASLSCQLGYI